LGRVEDLIYTESGELVCPTDQRAVLTFSEYVKLGRPEFIEQDATYRPSE